MGLGVLEDKVLDHVPGTTRYFDDPERPQFANNVDGKGLKCDTSGPVPIILVPQPSDDPNDPLNWPLWKRDLITFILSMVAIFATALGPILAMNTFKLAREFRITFDEVAQLTGWYLLGVGIGAFLFVPSGRIWGKRHLFVASTALLVASAAWGGGSRYNRRSMIASRVFQGVATAPFESLVNVAVGDLYCVHQRGLRMAFTNLAVFGGAFFTPIVVGKIDLDLGWPWSFYFIAIFTAAFLPLVYLFCPETAYRRDTSLNLDLLEREVVGPEMTMDTPEGFEPRGTDATAGGAADSSSGDKEGQTAGGDVKGIPRKATFRESLALFNGRKTDDSFIDLLLAPLPLFFQPAFIWGCLIQGLMIGWTVFIGVIIAQFFSFVPLWWEEDKTGYAYTSAFLGAIIGFVIAGLLSDWTARKMTVWNNGVYEPEFRIVLVIPQMLLGCAGLYGFGYGADGILPETHSPEFVLAFFGLEVAGMVIGAVASSLYIVDAYRGLAIEGFTCMIIFKNVFSFALTFKAFEWLSTTGTKATPLFIICGSIQVGVCLLSIPMYIYGKRVRSFFYRHPIIPFFGSVFGLLGKRSRPQRSHSSEAVATA